MSIESSPLEYYSYQSRKAPEVQLIARPCKVHCIRMLTTRFLPLLALVVLLEMPRHRHDESPEMLKVMLNILEIRCRSSAYKRNLNKLRRLTPKVIPDSE